MTWAKVYDAMQDGRYVRRASWDESAIIRIFIDDETMKSWFYATSSAKQYFVEQPDGGYRFNEEQHPSDDWEIVPYLYNFDNSSWYYVGTP
jgi:hypothetical protein